MPKKKGKYKTPNKPSISNDNLAVKSPLAINAQAIIEEDEETMESVSLSEISRERDEEARIALMMPPKKKRKTQQVESKSSSDEL